MDKIMTFIETVLVTFVSVFFLVLPWLGWTEDITPQFTYFAGMLVGAILIIMWIVVIDLWKD